MTTSTQIGRYSIYILMANFLPLKIVTHIINLNMMLCVVEISQENTNLSKGEHIQNMHIIVNIKKIVMKIDLIYLTCMLGVLQIKFNAKLSVPIPCIYRKIYGNQFGEKQVNIQVYPLYTNYKVTRKIQIYINGTLWS